MKLRDLQVPLSKGVLFAALATGGAAAQTAHRPVQPPRYAPNVFLSERPDKAPSLAIEADFLQKYMEKYGQKGRPLVLAIELPAYFQDPAETYFKSNRTPKDQEIFWRAIVRADSPNVSAFVRKLTEGKAVDAYVHPATSLIGHGSGPVSQRLNLMKVATAAHDQGFIVKFIDKCGCPGDVADHDQFMGAQLAALIAKNGNGVVVLDGSPRNSNALPEETAKDATAPDGSLPPIFILPVSHRADKERDPELRSAGEAMKALPIDYSSSRQSPGATPQNDWAQQR